MRPILLLITLLLLCSCHRQVLQSSTEETYNVPNISFFQMKVSEKDGYYDAKILNQQKVEGILDKPFSGIKVAEDQWLISFLDHKKNVLEQIVIENPLEVHFETTNDDGSWKNIDIKKNEAEFFFRVQYNPKFTGVKAEHILPNQKKEMIFSINF